MNFKHLIMLLLSMLSFGINCSFAATKSQIICHYPDGVKTFDQVEDVGIGDNTIRFNYQRKLVYLSQTFCEVWIDHN